MLSPGPPARRASHHRPPPIQCPALLKPRQGEEAIQTESVGAPASRDRASSLSQPSQTGTGLGRLEASAAEQSRRSLTWGPAPPLRALQQQGDPGAWIGGLGGEKEGDGGVAAERRAARETALLPGGSPGFCAFSTARHGRVKNNCSERGQAWRGRHCGQLCEPSVLGSRMLAMLAEACLGG